MNDFEDQLRTTLAERVRDVPPTPVSAAANIHRRARRLSLQRASVAAVAVVACVGGSLPLVTMRSDANRSVSASSDAKRPASASGVGAAGLITPIDNADPIGWTDSDVLPGRNRLYVSPPDGRTMMLVLRCARRGGSVDVEGNTGYTVSVTCDKPSGTVFEGRVTLTAAEDDQIFDNDADPYRYTGRKVTPHVTSGAWRLDVFRLGLSKVDDALALVDGRRPAPHQGTLVVPEHSPFQVAVECLGSVTLTVLIAGEEVGTVHCEAKLPHLVPTDQERVDRLTVSEELLQRAGVKQGERVSVEVVPTDAKTDQWRLMWG